jgi:hypothetical protein
VPKPGTTNRLYVLVNGGPNEWAIARNVPEGEDPDGVMVVRFDDIPDELADEIEEGETPGHVWEQLCQTPHQSL